MGALAGLLHQAGHEVRGSDAAVYPPMSEQLAALEIPVFEGFAADNLDWGPDRVVVGNTCPSDHIEVTAAREREFELTSFPAVIESKFLAERHPVVVAGTHGKTTTTSLLADTFIEAGRDAGFLVGGVPLSSGRGYHLGAAEEFVIEGDEYDSAYFDKGSKFLHYRPRTAVLTSVELDHVDIFSSMEEVRETFRKFVALIPEDGLLVVCAASAEALGVAESARCRVETYAFGDRAITGVTPTWHASAVEVVKGGRCRFDVTRGGEPAGQFETNLFGAHNWENVLATIAVASSRGIAHDDIRRAVSLFAGVKRRQEVRGLARGVFVIDDYGHHPTAVTETIKGLRQRFPGRRLLAMFEPRSATSRRRTFQREWADALAHADVVVVGRLFSPDRIPEGDRLDPGQLALEVHQRGTTAAYQERVEDGVDYIVERARPGDVVAVFSSGAFDGVFDKLLAALGDAVVPATPAELPAVRGVLERAGLDDYKDVRDDDHGKFLVLRNESGVVGCVALEAYGEDAILRSLAVDAEGRGQGYGWMLADTLINSARVRGVKRLYLLTDTASDFFAAKLGFRVVDAATVAKPVLQSWTFRQQRSKAATTMRLDL